MFQLKKYYIIYLQEFSKNFQKEIYFMNREIPTHHEVINISQIFTFFHVNHQ